MGNRKLIAQCWYSAEDYAEIKAAMEDGHRLPATHAEWEAGAKQREQQFSGDNAVVVRVPFDLAEFRSFCAHFKIRLDTNARQQFAAIKAQMHRDAH